MKSYDSLKILCCTMFLLLALASASFAQTLTSDKSDYPPGSTATLTGSGFAANEDVTLQVLHADGTLDTGEDHDPWTVAADNDGNFVATWHVCTDDCVGSLLKASADQSSGAHAEVTFTDDVTVTVTSSTSCVTVQSGTINHWNVVEGGSYTMTLSGTGCSDDEISVSIQNSNPGVGNHCYVATATGNPGEYSFNFEVPSPNCFTSPIRFLCGADHCGDSPGSFMSTGDDLRASNFSGTYPDCGTRTDDEDCSSCTISVVSTSETACPDNCATLTASGGSSYQWQKNGEDIPGATNSTLLVCSSGTYTAVADCGGSGSIDVHKCVCTPISCSVTGPDNVECKSSHTYSVTPSNCHGNPTYSWTVDGDATISGATDQSSVEVVAAHTCNGSYTVTVDIACNDCNDDPGGSECSKTVTVIDDIAPVISTTATNQNFGCDATITPPTFTGNDNCEGTFDPVLTTNGPTNTGCSYSQKWTANYTDECGNAATPVCITYTWKVSTSISLSAPNPLPVCGLSGNTLSVTNNGPGTISSYSWSVTGGNGWAIVGATTNSSITYTAGSGGTQGTFSVTVTNSCGCTSSRSVTFGNNCTEACGYTQGFYGGTGKDCSNKNAQTVMTNALTSSGGFTVGTSSHSICYRVSVNNVACGNFTASQIATCIGSHMPSGTTPAQLPSGDKNCSTANSSSYLSNNKYVSVLLGQVIALKFNIISSSSLSNLSVTGPYVTTYQATACTNGTAKPGTKLVKGPIPASVMTYMNTNYGSGWTVSQLWTAANNALGNGSSNPSLPDWTKACDIFNNAFDGCRILAGFGSNSSGVKESDQLSQPVSTSENLENMSIYPNPAVDQVNVSFTSASDMNATIDIYNVNGVLVDRVVSGVFATGESSLVHIDASQLSQGVYFIRIIQGDKTAIGKFILAR